MHRRRTEAKLAVCLCFIVTVASFPRQAASSLTALIAYPLFLTIFADIPARAILRRMALALPFCLFMALGIALFERSDKTAIFFSILLRSSLSVSAALLFVCTTPLAKLAAVLRRAHLPEQFVSLLEVTYRYLGVLTDETGTLYSAYILRSGGKRGIEARHMGSFAGGLLLKSLDRAERVSDARTLRGGASRVRPVERAATAADWLYAVGLCCAFALARRLDPVPAIGSLVLSWL